MIDKVCETNIPVLIQGETGTGKELVAKTIHYNGKRKDAKFVPVNCSAIPETLLESELFGYVKGAFTEATHDKPGLFEEADHGTIFLDEIGELSPKLQAKLLRVLEDGELRRLGDTKSRKVDIRIIAATSKNLEKEVKEKRFRDDLYYRINVMTINLPPLRNKREDIPLLATHFLQQFAKQGNKQIEGFDPTAMQLLLDYDWPGNVRELKNEIERAVALTPKGPITPNVLSPKLKKLLSIPVAPDLAKKSVAPEPKEKTVVPGLAEKPVAPGFIPGKGEALRLVLSNLKQMVGEYEKTLIEEALRKYNNNQTKVAQILGISRRGLIKKINKYKIRM